MTEENEVLEDSSDVEKKEETERQLKDIAENPMEKAKNMLKQIKEENDRKEKLLLREEELRAHEMLGGKSRAGKESKEESPEEYAKRIMAGDL